MECDAQIIDGGENISQEIEHRYGELPSAKIANQIFYTQLTSGQWPLFTWTLFPFHRLVPMGLRRVRGERTKLKQKLSKLFAKKLLVLALMRTGCTLK